MNAMSDTSEGRSGFIAGLIIGCVVATIAGLLIGFWACNGIVNQIQSEAVRHNAGHWEVRENGTTFFRWNTGEQPEAAP